MKTCTIEGCGRDLLARGYCRRHYAKWRKYGDPLVVKPRAPRAPCSVEGCGRLSNSKGLCGMHYMRTRPRRDRPKMPPRDRGAELLARVAQGDGCWLWTGSVEPSGYGRFYWQGTRTQAHRAVYEHLVGPIPDGLHLDHLCRVRQCVRPDHLEPVTDQVNILRGTAPTAANAKKTHCVRGHELAGANLILRRDGRECRECQRIRSREFRQRRKAA